MTVVLDRPSPSDDRPERPKVPSSTEPSRPTGRGAPTAPSATSRPTALPLTPRRIAVVVVAWVVVTLVGIVLVLYQVGPLLEQRDQRSLLGQYRTDIRQAANESFGLPGTEAPTRAVSIGTPVGILDVNALELRQVAVEGTAPDQTRRGPAHVVGTAGLGQPGNAVLVGRRSLFGGPFRTLGDLREGDRILVTTVQGRSVYEVGHVGRHRIVEGDGAAPAGDVPATNVSADEAAETGDAAPVLPQGTLTEDELYGPSDDDRLTLVTSASSSPWASDEALVVVAELDGLPFAPTPQGGRTDEGDGRGGDPGALAPLLLALLAYGGAVTAAVVSYRRVAWRSAYLLTAPPLVALTIVLAEQLARALPAWA